MSGLLRFAECRRIRPAIDSVHPVDQVRAALNRVDPGLKFRVVAIAPCA